MLLRAILVALCLVGPPVAAQDRVTLGYGRLFTNDLLGDGYDRWRTGSYFFSIIRGPEWQGQRPERPGAILEYRFRTEIIAPGFELAGGQTDRPYVGVSTSGLHSHWRRGALDVSFGLDWVAVGPSTGLSVFQEWYHDQFSMPAPIGTEQQLPDADYLGVTAELAVPLALGDRLTFRPFIEAQTGVEEIGRLGADLIWGSIGHEDLLIRDPVTGTLIRGTEGGSGLALVAGFDLAAVSGSVYLPRDRGVTPEPTRARARIGLHWQAAEDMSFYYGATWLSEEFEGQDGSQIVGSIKVNFAF
jgi:hypothetical protein